MKTDRSFFYRLKTATLLLLLLAVSLVTMLRVHPVVSLLSACSGALSLLLYGGRGELRALLRFCLPVGLLLILFNLAFNRNGVTVLFYIGDASVTLESILYALFTAFAFYGAVLWFSFFCAFLDSDRVYRLFARFSKGLAVIFSLSLALVPKILEKYEEIKLQERAETDKKHRFTQNILQLSALFSWVLADSFETAVSMKARGALLKEKRQTQKQKATVADILLWILSIACIALMFFSPPMLAEIYPKFREEAYLTNSISYLPLFLLYFSPVIFKIWEVTKWKLIARKI